MASDDKVLINLSHAAGHPENVLTAYLAGVEAVRAGKHAVRFLTMDGVHAGVKGFADTIHVDDAPSRPRPLVPHESARERPHAQDRSSCTSIPRWER